MTKTPEELALDWIADNRVESMPQPVTSAFLAGYKAGREMSNKEIFDEYIRLREKHQATAVERIKVRVMGIFG